MPFFPGKVSSLCDGRLKLSGSGFSGFADWQDSTKSSPVFLGEDLGEVFNQKIFHTLRKVKNYQHQDLQKVWS
jgi:hypothetical protein